MTLEKDKKEHHHHKPLHHHHHHPLSTKPETGTTEDSHNVIEGHESVVTCYGNDEIRALKEELEIESKMRCVYES